MLSLENESDERYVPGVEYFKALQTLIATTTDAEVKPLAMFELAEQHIILENSDYPDISGIDVSTIQALALCEEIVESYPESFAVIDAKRLILSIKEIKVNLTSRRVVESNKAFRVLLEYKNTEELELVIFKDRLNPKADSYGVANSTFINYIKELDSVYVQRLTLTNFEDYQSHSIELLLPALEYGSYIIALFDSNDERTPLSYNRIQSNSLVLFDGDEPKSEVFMLRERSRGEPIKGARYHFSTDKVGYKDRKGKTDSDGIFRIDKENDTSVDWDLLVTHKKDTIKTEERVYKHNNYDDGELFAQVAVFLDRGVYRPGQRVYFKGIYVLDDNGKRTVIPNEYVFVEVYDSDYNAIYESELKTNEFGSFNGSFLLPKDALNGNFEISVEESYDHDETPFYKNLFEDGEFLYTEKRFLVVSYKRPKFEFKMDPISQVFLPGDTIELSGSASSLMGSPVAGASGSFTVKRRVAQRKLSFSYMHTSEIYTSGQFQTDANGDFSISFPSGLSGESTVEVIEEFVVNIKITDINGESQELEEMVNISTKHLNENAIERYGIPEAAVGQELNLDYTFEDLNQVGISAKVDLAIYWIGENYPGTREWDIPEVQTIPRAEFKKLFPLDPYQFTEVQDRAKEAVFKIEGIESYGNWSPAITPDASWGEGKFKVVLDIEDAQGKTYQRTHFIEVANPANDYLDSGDLLTMRHLNTDTFIDDGKLVLELRAASDDFIVLLMGSNNEKVFYTEFVEFNGKKIVELPIPSSAVGEVTIRADYIYQGKHDTKEVRVNMNVLKEQFNFTQNTFRSTIEPGVKERWSFTLADENAIGVNAEVLASMYDTAIDKFGQSAWELDFDFQYNYYYDTNFLFNYNDFYSRGSKSLLPYKSYYRYPLQLPVLNWYGFDFGTYSNTYRDYIRRLPATQSADLIGKGEISGIVTDDLGLPLPGVNVFVKGASIGTTTDFDGRYSIQANADDVLVFSYIGFSEIELELSGDQRDISMVAGEEALDSVAIISGKTAGVQVSNMESVIVTGGGGNIGQAPLLTAQEMVERLRKEGFVLSITLNQGTVFALPTAGYQREYLRTKALVILDGVPFSSDTSAQSWWREDGGFGTDEVQIVSVNSFEGEAATTLYGTAGRNGIIVISTGYSYEKLAQVETRKNLSETAFFFPELRTTETGEVSFEFESPEALSRWKLRLFAHTKDMNTTTLARTLITRKDLSLLPNNPRFIRAEDTLVYSAKVVNMTEEPMVGAVRLEIFEAFTMQPLEQVVIDETEIKNFAIGAAASTTVNWKLNVPEGTNAIVYRIVASSGDFSDGEEAVIPVLSNRVFVNEALPLFVPKNDSLQISFDNLKENQSSSRIDHKLKLEYMSNPAWSALFSLPYLIQFEHQCAEQTYSRYYANALSAHIMNSNPELQSLVRSWIDKPVEGNAFYDDPQFRSMAVSNSPWLEDLLSEGQRLKNLGLLFQPEDHKAQQEELLLRLDRHRTREGAYTWFIGGKPNAFITRYILSANGRLAKITGEDDLRYQFKDAVEYLDENIVKEYKLAEEFNPDTSSFLRRTSSVHYLYTRSYFSEVSVPVETQEVIAKMLEANQANWVTRSLYEKVLLAVVYHRNGNLALAKKILNNLKESAVRSEVDGMYHKENVNGYYWQQDAVATQVALIEAFWEISQDAEIVSELQLWLLQNKRTNHWSNTKTTAEAVYGLLLNRSIEDHDPSTTLIRVGGELISGDSGENSSEMAALGYTKVEWEANEISSELATVSIANSSQQAGYGGFYWQYFEDSNKVLAAQSDVLQIQRELFLVRVGNDGERLVPVDENTIIKVGDKLKMRLMVSNTVDMEYLHLENKRASGLEPTELLSGYTELQGAFVYQSTGDTATHFFFDELKKGVYVVEYELFANNAGYFSNGFASIESMYAPEFKAQTDGFTISIED